MNKPYGVSGAITGLPFPDLSETFAHGDLTIEIHNGAMAVGSDNPIDPGELRRFGQRLAEAYSLEHGRRVSADLNHSRERGPLPGSTSAAVNLQTIAVVSTPGPVRVIVSRDEEVLQDSASFRNVETTAEKAMNNATLAEALQYFSAEVLDDDRPLYGIYKALEPIVHQLESAGARDGRAALASLAGRSAKYVSDVMQTAQMQRHARTASRRKISDQECCTRAARLIKAYAASLQSPLGSLDGPLTSS